VLTVLTMLSAQGVNNVLTGC